MKKFLRIAISVLVVLVSLSVVSYVNLTGVNKTPSGNFVLIGGSAGLLAGLGALIPFVYVYWKEKSTTQQKIETERQLSPRERLESGLADLFVYSTREKRDESKLYQAAEKIVKTARELAEHYKLRFNVLYKDNAPHMLVRLAEHATEDIRHTTHLGTRYVINMRKDLYDGKLDDLPTAKGALRFLEDMRPVQYGQTAEDLYTLVDKIFR